MALYFSLSSVATVVARACGLHLHLEKILWSIPISSATRTLLRSPCGPLLSELVTERLLEGFGNIDSEAGFVVFLSLRVQNPLPFVVPSCAEFPRGRVSLVLADNLGVKRELRIVEVGPPLAGTLGSAP